MKDDREWQVLGVAVGALVAAGLVLAFCGFHQPTTTVEQPPLTDAPAPEPVPAPVLPEEDMPKPEQLPAPETPDVDGYPDVPDNTLPSVPEAPEPTPLPSQPVPKQYPLPQANKSTASTAFGGTVEAAEMSRGSQSTHLDSTTGAEQ